MNNEVFNRETVGLAIAAYNAEDTLARAVASIQAQGGSVAQIVIVDDGSTDSTLSIANNLAKTDERITVVTQKNCGAPVARNRAFSLLTTDWVAYLDSDDALSKDYLDTFGRFISQHPEYDVYMCNAIRINTRGKVALYRKLEGYYEVALGEMISGSQTVGGGALMRAGTFSRAGGFDSEIRVAQDYDLWLRILAEGLRIVMLKEPLLHYYNSIGSLCSNPVRNLYATRGILEKLMATYNLSPECRELAEKHREEKTTKIKQSKYLEKIRKKVEPVFGDYSNRFFFWIFTSAAGMLRTIKGK